MAGLGAITLFVSDVDRSKAWYQHVLGLSLVFEDDNSAVVKMDNLVVNLLDRGEAPELIAPAPVGRPDGAARALFTLWVVDTAGVVEQLRKRGATIVNGPLDRPWNMRTACFADPDGHLWEIAQPINQGDEAPPG